MLLSSSKAQWSHTSCPQSSSSSSSFSLPNSLALVTFTCTIREKKPAVIYMSHLACVDLLFTLLLPMKIHYQLNASDWVFGEAACVVLSAVTTATCTAPYC
ncbi:hypothetical protein QQF64_026128 [Cirrhinus molitorella]|uniref:G-protein coupled receptors family 1 profile domain-containing protein n=1 Tax=Cirrhinus molitorella TaxID=172907 RepID=A0ABR3M743_9TELE